ncbi:hypothetical protein ACHAQJ_005731 [Trichoderma viride]
MQENSPWKPFTYRANVSITVSEPEPEPEAVPSHICGLTQFPCYLDCNCCWLALINQKSRCLDSPLRWLINTKTGEPIYRANFGFGHLEANKPIGSTQVPIGTIGTTFTATAARALVAEGKLTPTKSVIPELQTAAVGATEDLAIVDLLSHRSGLVNRSRGAETILLIDKDRPSTLVSQGHGIALLYLVGIRNEGEDSPSWKPNWSNAACGLDDASQRGVLYQASGDLEPKIGISSLDSKILCVEGHLIDEISRISKWSNYREHWIKFFKEIDTLVSSLKTHHSSEELISMRFHVPIAGTRHPKVAGPEGVDLEE